jgi:hypothetical protein
LRPASIVGLALEFGLLCISLLLEQGHLMGLLPECFACIPGGDNGKESQQACRDGR